MNLNEGMLVTEVPEIYCTGLIINVFWAMTKQFYVRVSSF